MSAGPRHLAIICVIWATQLVGCATQEPTSGVDAAVPVLLYHEIVTNGKTPGGTVISLDRFAEEMRYLADNGYQPVSVEQLVSFMRSGTPLPAHPVVLTFDDGWKNVLNAVPILERYHFKASFWIVTGKGIGGDGMDWTDLDSLERNPLFEVESHTVTHPWDKNDNLVTWVEGKVPGKGIDMARAELAGSKRELERRLRRPANYLAWPCGWYNDVLVRLAQDAGYQALFTAESGLNRHPGDVMRIKRTVIDGSCGIDEFAKSVADGKYRICENQRAAALGRVPPG